MSLLQRQAKAKAGQAKPKAGQALGGQATTANAGPEAQAEQATGQAEQLRAAGQPGSSRSASPATIRTKRKNDGSPSITFWTTVQAFGEGGCPRSDAATPWWPAFQLEEQASSGGVAAPPAACRISTVSSQRYSTTYRVGDLVRVLHAATNGWYLCYVNGFAHTAIGASPTIGMVLTSFTGGTFHRFDEAGESVPAHFWLSRVRLVAQEHLHLLDNSMNTLGAQYIDHFALGRLQCARYMASCADDDVDDESRRLVNADAFRPPDVCSSRDVAVAAKRSGGSTTQSEGSCSRFAPRTFEDRHRQHIVQTSTHSPLLAM